MSCSAHRAKAEANLAPSTRYNAEETNRRLARIENLLERLLKALEADDD